MISHLFTAHLISGNHHDFLHGFFHPLLGLDHLLAIVAIGIWASQLRGRAIWTIPATFISLMLIGGVFGMASMTAPFVETGIALSIFCIGLLILSATRLPETASLILTGLFALCHGQAHGSEMPADASGFSYAFGFVIATASLHLTGILIGLRMQRLSETLFRVPLIRASGLAIIVAGLAAIYPS